MEKPPHSDSERPGWSGYIAAIVASALGHAGLLAFALFVMPKWLHSETIDNPSMTVKIVDNIPAGDLGTHLPKLSGHNKPPPEEVAKAEVKPEPPPSEEKPPEPPPPIPKPEDDKNAISLNSPGPTPTPTPEPPPAVIAATPEPTATETPQKVAEPKPTPAPPPLPKQRHREKVIVHKLPPKPAKPKNTPVMMAKAESTPDIHEQFRNLQQQMLKKRIEEAKRRAAEEANSEDDSDADASNKNSADDSSEHGPVASTDYIPGKGYGIGGAGPGSAGALEDLQYLLYFRTVQQRVKDAWTFPGGSNDLKAEVEFSIGPEGSLNGVKINKGSGDAAFDDSVVRAIRRAAPFPPPPDKYRAQFSDVVSTFNLGQLKS